MVCVSCHAGSAAVDAPEASQTAADAPGSPDAAALLVADPAAPTEEAAVVEPLLSDGEAGGSARREGERRRAKREQATMARHPRLGKLILAVSDEPHTERSWGKGAVGEEALGAKLNRFASERCVILHDRRIPGSRANIDQRASGADQIGVFAGCRSLAVRPAGGTGSTWYASKRRVR